MSASEGCGVGSVFACSVILSSSSGVTTSTGTALTGAGGRPHEPMTRTAPTSATCRAADTVAVLPLFNVNQAGSANLDWIGESVAETVREALSSSGVLVLSREDREEVYRRIELKMAIRRSIMESPYLEHLSSRFAYYLSRIALPSEHSSDE